MNNIFAIFKNPKFKYGAYSTLLTVGVIVGIILVNLIISTLSDKVNLKLDLTKEKIFEFSQQTNDVLKNLKNDVKFTVLFSSNLQGGQNKPYIDRVNEFIDRYKKGSNGKIKVEYLDPVKNPGIAAQYQKGGEEISDGTIIISTGSKFKVVSVFDFFKSTENAQSIQAEQKLTNALINLISGLENTVYILEGHSSYDAADIKTALEKENYKTQNVNLLASNIPTGLSALVIAAPEKDLAPTELEKLDAYLQNGGNLLVYFNPQMPRLDRLNSYLTEWGISPQNNIAAEESKELKVQSPYYIIAGIQQHEITSKISRQNAFIIVPVSMSLTLSEKNTQNAKVSSILKTSANSYTKLLKDIKDEKASTIPGPHDLAAIAEKQDNKGGKIFVLGSVSAVAGGNPILGNILENTSIANRDFLLNTFAYTLNVKEGISIRPKVISPSTLTMTDAQKTNSVWAIIVVLILILAGGITVWFRRRYL